MTATHPTSVDYEFHEDSHDIRQIVTPFGLNELPALLRQMYDTGAILAGGAAANLIYNIIHPEATHLLDPESDLDFWVADPTPTPSHARRVYYTLVSASWDRFLEEAGYESYCPIRSTDPSGNTYTDDDEGGGFLSDSGIRLRVRYYQRTDPLQIANRRIQLIFYDADPIDTDPAATLVRQFDLSICRCLLFTSAVNRRWITRTYAAQDFWDRRIVVSNPTPSVRTQTRLLRYLSRYPTFTSDTFAEPPVTSG